MAPNNLQSPSLDADRTDYHAVGTPKKPDTEAPASGSAINASFEPFAVKPILFSSVALVLLLVVQFGWSVSQLNLSTFNKKEDCNARPVPEGKCLMFPGHKSSEWSLAVNMWIVGGMIGSLGSGHISDLIGRRKSLLINAVIVIIGSVVQASAQSIGVLAVGRFISGIGSGTSTSIPNSFINEISPPHLRNRLGVLYQCSVGVGIILVGLSFFFADTKSGWRYIAGFPIVLAVIFMLCAPMFMVESPTWLLNKGRREEAEREMARLYGEENVKRALNWLAVRDPEDEAEQGAVRASTSGHSTEGSDVPAGNPFVTLFTQAYRAQTILAIMLSFAQQLSGINAVFFYSSSIFKDAGLSDDRIGTIIVDVVNLFPTFFAGALGTRFGNRNMILWGHAIMMFSAVGITISLVATVSWLSIVFTAIYVAAFAVSLGPLVFVVATAIFPNQLRASGTAMCLFANWIGTLVVGIGYPHVADALDDWGFTPFVVLLALFGLYMLKFLPETSGKTSEEIEEIFRARLKKASA